MNGRVVISAGVISLLFIAISSNLNAAWPAGGILACGEAEWQYSPKIVSDGAGGMILAWQDERSPDMDIYAQRIDGSGNAMWDDGGILLSTKDSEFFIDLVSDGAGGAIAVWYNSSKDELTAYRFGPDGSYIWAEAGVVVNSYYPLDLNIVASPDGAGGLLLAWLDTEVGPPRLMAQKLDSNANEKWTDFGVQVSPDPDGDVETEYYMKIIHDGMGGALIAFRRSPVADLTLCVQRVYANGSLWSPAGIGVSSYMGDDYYPAIRLDSSGWVFLAWQTGIGTVAKIFAQKLDLSGTLQWTPEAYVCVLSGSHEHPDIVPDGNGGVCVVWDDDRNGNSDIYGQRLDAFGTALWTDQGVPVCDAVNDQEWPILESGHPGSFIITWEDNRSAEDLYAQKVDIAGEPLWTADGVHLLSTMFGFSDNNDYDLVTDGSGGLMATAMDERLAAYGDIYAQSLNAFGVAAAPEPSITGIDDVPGDEGGVVRIIISRSDRDHLEQVLEPVTFYDVWRRIDGLAAAASFMSSAKTVAQVTATGPAGRSGELSVLENDSGRFIVAAPMGAFPEGTWEFTGSFGASQVEEYIVPAATLADSTASGIPYAVFTVAARTTNPFVWFVSAPDSGYSVDNNAPAPPMSLAGEQSQSPEGLQLTWDQNMENDLWYYAVYRGTEETFTPGPGNMIATPTDPEWFDDGWEWETEYWYKLSAVDIHGNESGYALLGPSEITGDDHGQVPVADYLRQNYPNPFNPHTTIAFGLKSASHVSLAVYDATGRRVRILLDDELEAGTYEESWDGRDDSGSRTASGIYFYRLVAGDFVQTRKIVLLR